MLIVKLTSFSCVVVDSFALVLLTSEEITEIEVFTRIEKQRNFSKSLKRSLIVNFI